MSLLQHGADAQWWWIPTAALGSAFVYHVLTRDTPERLGWSGPKSLPIVAHIPATIKNLHRINDVRLEWTLKYMKDGVWGTCSSTRNLLHLCDAESIKYVLHDNFANYVKSPEMLGIFEEFLGDGIFNANGDKWLWQRKAASHMFSMKSIRESMIPELLVCSKKLSGRLSEKVESGESFDLQDLYFRATMDGISRIAFGKDVCSLDNDDQVPFARSFDAATLHTFWRAINPFWKLQRYLQVGSEKHYTKHLKVIDEFAYDVIRERRRRLEANPDADDGDVLSLFIKRAKQDGEELSERFLRDIVLSFVIAGRDTTACLLSWMTLELIRNPDIEEKVLAEVDSIFGRDGPLHFDGLKKMEYTDAVIFETSRFHPSVPSDTKAAVNDDVLPNGVKIKGGDSIMYAPYTLGRLPTLWKDPNTFKPSRWLDGDSDAQEESTTSIDQYKFVNFNAGPRLCLGKHLAIFEAKLFVAALVREFRFALASPSAEFAYGGGVTMNIKGGLHVKAFRRSK